MRAMLIGCLTGMLLAGAADTPKKAGKPAEKAATSTMTGCVDQRGDNYVLTGDKELNAFAVLHGEGFSDDNFARYMGHKVSVEGSTSRDGENVTVKVKKITDLADTCSPE